MVYINLFIENSFCINWFTIFCCHSLTQLSCGVFWVKYVSFYIFFHVLNVLVLINLYYSMFIACIEVTNFTTKIIGVFWGFFISFHILLWYKKTPKILFIKSDCIFKKKGSCNCCILKHILSSQNRFSSLFLLPFTIKYGNKK